MGLDRWVTYAPVRNSFSKTKIYSITAVNLVHAKRLSCLYKNEES